MEETKYECSDCGQTFSGTNAEARRDAHENGEDSSDNDLSDEAQTT